MITIAQLWKWHEINARTRNSVFSLSLFEIFSFFLRPLRCSRRRLHCEWGWVNHNSNTKNVQYPVANAVSSPSSLYTPSISVFDCVNSCTILWYHVCPSVRPSVCLGKIKVSSSGSYHRKSTEFRISYTQALRGTHTLTHIDICLLYNVECFVICECVSVLVYFCVRK